MVLRIMYPMFTEMGVMKICLALLISVLAFAASFANDLSTIEVRQNKEYVEDAANTIALINHINYVVETVRTYNNVLILEQEYRNISADNLNLNKIPDEDVLDLITKILESLNGMRMRDRQRKHAESLLERELASKKVTSLQDCALLSAASGIREGGIVKGLKSALRGMVAGAIDSFVEYKKFQQLMQSKIEDEKFELETSKLEELHRLNVQLLKSEWMLIRKYKLDDSLRVTGENVCQMVGCLKDANHTRIYRRLLPMEKILFAYPTYWYYRVMLALDQDRIDDVLYSSRKFSEVNRGLFRHDSMALAVVMARISASIVKGQIDASQIRKDLEFVELQNYDSSNVDAGIFSAMVYCDVLNDPTKAFSVLVPVLDMIDSASDNRLTDYCDLFTEKKEAPRDLYTPTSLDATRCRMVLTSIKNKQGQKIDVEKLKSFCKRESTCSLEKLFYFGKLRISDLKRLVEDDIWHINVYSSIENDANVLNVDIPLKWYYLGDFAYDVVFEHDGVELSSIKDNGERSIQILAKPFFLNTEDNEIYVHTKVRVPKDIMSRFDTLKLNLVHKTWPVEVLFKPDHDNRTVLRPIAITKFMGEDFDESGMLKDHGNHKVDGALVDSTNAPVKNVNHLSFREQILATKEGTEDYEILKPLIEELKAEGETKNIRKLAKFTFSSSYLPFDEGGGTFYRSWIDGGIPRRKLKNAISVVRECYGVDISPEEVLVLLDTTSLTFFDAGKSGAMLTTKGYYSYENGKVPPTEEVGFRPSFAYKDVTNVGIVNGHAVIEIASEAKRVTPVELIIHSLSNPGPLDFGRFVVKVLIFFEEAHRCED